MLNEKQQKIIKELRIELGFNYINDPNINGDYTAMILDLVHKWWLDQPENTALED